MPATVRLDSIELGNHATYSWRSINSPIAKREVPTGTDVKLSFTLRNLPGGIDAHEVGRAAFLALPGALPDLVVATGGHDLLLVNCWVVVKQQAYEGWLEMGVNHPVAQKVIEKLLELIAANAPKK